LTCADAGAAAAILDVDPLVVAGVRTYRVHSWSLRRGQRLHSMKRLTSAALNRRRDIACIDK